jgi:hypothetical protein
MMTRRIVVALDGKSTYLIRKLMGEALCAISEGLSSPEKHEGRSLISERPSSQSV